MHAHDTDMPAHENQTPLRPDGTLILDFQHVIIIPGSFGFSEYQTYLTQFFENIKRRKEYPLHIQIRLPVVWKSDNKIHEKTLETYLSLTQCLKEKYD